MEHVYGMVYPYTEEGEKEKACKVLQSGIVGRHVSGQYSRVA